jgi:hypothetical protein
MDEILNAKEIFRLASLELNLLQVTRSLPVDILRDARLEMATPIYDTNGEELFHRIPLSREGASIGYADAAAHTAAFGAPLLAVAPGANWNERKIVAEAEEAYHRGVADKRFRAEGYDEIRFVAYSYPKIALQFLQKQEEVLMLECFTWLQVPPARQTDRKKLEPSNFERWSLLDELPPERKKTNQRDFEERLSALGDANLDTAARGFIVPMTALFTPIKLTLTREIHYSGRNSDHHVCYELRGQETNVWCVGASVQMLLDFYRYNYSQTRIAVALGLGTPGNPNGLPYSRVGDVVTQLQALSSNALTAHMIINPTFSAFTSELARNRPMISFVPGHSRTVAGYTESLFVFVNQLPFRGLLVYDPWPPNAGVITRWENFAAQTYQYAYSAHVTTI